MKAKVIKDFYDLEHPENTYRVGDEFEGTAERVDGLAKKGFVEKPARQTRARKAKAAEE